MFISRKTFIMEYLLLLTSAILFTARYLPVIMQEAFTVSPELLYAIVSTMR